MSGVESPVFLSSIKIEAPSGIEDIKYFAVPILNSCGSLIETLLSHEEKIHKSVN